MKVPLMVPDVEPFGAVPTEEPPADAPPLVSKKHKISFHVSCISYRCSEEKLLN